jgi:hypothetical protein
MEGDPVLEVVVDGSATEASIAPDQRVPERFEYTHEGQLKSIGTAIVARLVPRAHGVQNLSPRLHAG